MGKFALWQFVAVSGFSQVAYAACGQVHTQNYNYPVCDAYIYAFIKGDCEWIQGTASLCKGDGLRSYVWCNHVSKKQSYTVGEQYFLRTVDIYSDDNECS